MNGVISRFRIVLTTVAVGVCLCAGVEAASDGGHWVSAWSTAMHAPLPFPGLPPTPVFENQTIRMVVRPTIGGSRLRIRLDNAFGTARLTIGAAHVAVAAGSGKIVSGSDHALTFGGKTSVTIPPGAPVLSDPVEMKVDALAELAVSIYMPQKATAETVHFWGQHETYISRAGDFTSQPELPVNAKTTSWYWLADAEVWSDARTGAIVALGDSITDGAGAKQGEYQDWPDLLAARLHGRGSQVRSVVNEGIGGNRILYDGAGVSALARFDRDVLAQPGVTDLIVLEGINDIGWPRMRPPKQRDGSEPKVMPFAREVVSADDLIRGLKQIIARAHEHGVRVFGATLTPYEGADYYTEDGEATRKAVNEWIRTGGAFDGVFDFDAAVRDPAHPTRFRDGYHSGDHLHPSAEGYKAMAGVVDEAAFR